jgi:hypothetical protein
MDSYQLSRIILEKAPVVYQPRSEFRPTYQVEKSWIVSRGNTLWLHAKNKEAFYQLGQENLHYFWHQTDKYTLTSKGIPWCYPKQYAKNGITVIRGINLPTEEVYGICTDYALTMKRKTI